MQTKGILSVLLLFSMSVAAQEKPSLPQQANIGLPPQHANSRRAGDPGPFGDPAGATPAQSSGVEASSAGETLTLDAVVREALAKNPAVQSALHTIAAQRRRVPQVRSLPDPMVSAGWAGNITPFSVQEGDPASNRNVSVTQGS